MRHLPIIGRIFYSIAIVAMGLQTIYTRRLPYMLIPPTHLSPTTISALAYVIGSILFLTGISIAFNKTARLASLLSGCLLLLVFCFGFIPYELLADPNYLQFGAWENAEKELALSSGAFVIAGCFKGALSNKLYSRVLSFGSILFALTVLCFGTDHLLYAKDAADYVPVWVPNHIFWIYFTGIALIGSGLTIILKIKPALFATLLGLMIFTWFIILHIPKVIEAPSAAEMRGELTSALLALAYSGTAFVIATSTKIENKG